MGVARSGASSPCGGRRDVSTHASCSVRRESGKLLCCGCHPHDGCKIANPMDEAAYVVYGTSVVMKIKYRYVNIVSSFYDRGESSVGWSIGSPDWLTIRHPRACLAFVCDRGAEGGGYTLADVVRREISKAANH